MSKPQLHESSVALGDPACLDDNTAYYGNNLKILDGYDSSSECQMHCDKFSGCSFWSFRKSNGRCFLKNSKVPQTTFMYFTFTITLHLYMFDVSIFLSIGWRKSVCSQLRSCDIRQQSGVCVWFQRLPACKLSDHIILQQIAQQVMPLLRSGHRKNM